MSSVRVQKIFEGLPEQLKRLGGYNVTSAIKWQGRDASGKDACLIDLDSTAWADNNRRVILVAKEASDKNDTAGMKTQSHSLGQAMGSSVSLIMYAETPEDHTGAQAQWMRVVQQAIVGQLGCPLQILLTANDVEPTVSGVNGAVATTSTTDAGTLLPYGGVGYPGGI